MARENRDSSRRSASQADWLGCEQPGRKRPWALEQQLFGTPVSGSEELLRALAERLSRERLVLDQIDADRQGQQRKVAELEGELKAIGETDRAKEPSAVPSNLGDRPSQPVLMLRSTSRQPDRDYWLSRCEGFLVESPTGRGVGVVEGLRYGLRIDRPDLLEVGVGRLRRRVLLVPVDQVEHISNDDGLVILSRDPLTPRTLVHDLLARARAKLPLSPA